MRPRLRDLRRHPLKRHAVLLVVALAAIAVMSPARAQQHSADPLPRHGTGEPGHVPRVADAEPCERSAPPR
ncbi:hypothetical protein [Streptomyces sp. t39]|uniref:hypothetical protein n=1 Tax=Streptomyces sp. t39 TaxID=1828156 RepID=UPI0011CE7D41|nr:hypothetical protein [Streptomyces sp. t39]TXS51252.1 hypothetical protein EAO77_25550 [Streptomyces sp. t39]